MFPILNIGPLAIQTPGLIILVGLWVWFLMNDRYAKKLTLTAEVLSNNLFYSLLLGLIGARIGLIIQSPKAFMDDPLAVISPNLALFDFSTGIFVAVVSFLIFTQRKKQPFLKTLDAVTPGLMVLLGFTAFSFLASGKLYGLPGNLPWSIYLWGTLRHPLQIYYLVLFLLGAGFIVKLFNESYPAGTIFTIGIIIAALIILFLEAFRGSPAAMIGNIRLPQIFALVVLLISLKKIKLSPQEPTV